ncbi:hypothetical protein LCGC14_2225620 [marine sediment metagenome]|uniref:Uncharacterized protein n=1 Tax=marine sediment metagenome TaxID=412755 RepID=A0A0F9G551_9ZZZZ
MVDEHKREKLQRSAQSFLESGERVQLGLYGTSIPISIQVVAVLILVVLVLEGPRLLDDVAELIAVLLFAVAVRWLTYKLRGRLVVLTDRNLYVLAAKGRKATDVLIKHPRDSVAVMIGGSPFDPTLVLGDQTIYVDGPVRLQRANAIIKTAQPGANVPAT